MTCLNLASVVVANQGDRSEFLTEAMQMNLAEISLGQLAQTKGSDERVRSFGRMLEEEHNKLNSEAAQLAETEGITPPLTPRDIDQKTYSNLAELSGREFDQAFGKAMVMAHLEAISKFKVASEGTDAVARFASESLPSLLKHRDMAKLIASK
jgi:putative membrane protein